MKAVIKLPGESFYMADLPPSASVLASIVGGTVEEIAYSADCRIVYDADGMKNGKASNNRMVGMKFYGPVVFVGWSKNGYTDVPSVISDAFRLLISK